MQLPKSDSRTTIVGSTGSGKTQFAVWLLSTRNWLIRPWIIIDYKGDSLINSLGAVVIGIKDPIPTRPGIYIVKPIPDIDDDALTDFLWRIWSSEYCGLYIDEGYMIGNKNSAFTALLTQGRSKEIEMIVLVQRPVWANKFIFSEANQLVVIGLNIEDDKKLIRNYLGGLDVPSLPKYHAMWYSSDHRDCTILAPVPSRTELIARFEPLQEQPRRQLI